MALRVGSLFAGIGGFDLAAEQVGMEVVWQSEIDQYANHVLAHHWPEVPNYGDIHDIRLRFLPDRRLAISGVDRRTVTAVEGGEQHRDSISSGYLSSGGCFYDDDEWLGATEEEGGGVLLRSLERGSEQRQGVSGSEPDAESGWHEQDTIGFQGEVAGVDVLTGGFPCQSYSVAGNRGGLADDRGALWWEYHRLIEGLSPTWVVGENVPGLISSRGGEDFETILRSLTELGYGVVWAVLDAQYFGVAQRRRRVFIVGHSGGIPRPEILALGEGVFGNPAPSREEGALVTQSLTGGPNSSSAGSPDDNRAQGNFLVPHTPFGYEDDLELGHTVTGPSGGLSGKYKQYTLVFEDDRSYGPRMDKEVSSSLPARMGEGGNNGPLAASQVVHENSHVASSSVRRLTPMECERLQGFPDGFTDIPTNSNTQRYRQLGNALAVPVARWILARIAAAD